MLSPALQTNPYQVEAPLQSRHYTKLNYSFFYFVPRDTSLTPHHSWTPTRFLTSVKQGLVYTTRTTSEIIYIASEWGIQRNHGSGNRMP